MNTRSATWTPPRPLRGSRRRGGTAPRPGRPGDARATRRRARSPTAHEPRTTSASASARPGRRAGPSRSSPRPRRPSSDRRIRLADVVGQAHRLRGDDAHDDDDRVDRVGVEEPPEQEAAEARHRPGVPDRRRELVRTSATTSPQARSGFGSAAARGRRGRSGSRRARTGRATRTNRSTTGHVEEEDQEADEDRAAVADRHADARQPPARRRRAHRPERRVVVDQRRLVGEVRDDEQQRARRAAARGPIRAVGTMHSDREEEQERQAPAAAPVAQRAEDRRDERVEADARRRSRC